MEQIINDDIRNKLILLLETSTFAISNKSRIAGYFNVPWSSILQLNEKYPTSYYDWFTGMLENWIQRNGQRTLNDFVDILKQVEDFNFLRGEVCKKFSSGPTCDTSKQITESHHLQLPEYKLSGPTIGNAFIVNIVNFEDESRKREGTEVDVRKLEELFSQLSIKTSHNHDTTKEGIIKEFNQFLKTVGDKNENQCVMIVVMTYASDSEMGSFICSDLQEISVEEEILPKLNTPKLKGKPKILIMEFYADIVINPECGKDKDDIMVIYGGFGTFSNRHEAIGSWFIEIFCDIVREYKNEEIKDLIQLINLQLEKNAKIINGWQQCGYYQYRFKKFRFSRLGV